MKTLIVAAGTAALLALSACGGGSSTTENVTVTNEVVTNGEDFAIDSNLTAVDDPSGLDNGADANLIDGNVIATNAL